VSDFDHTGQRRNHDPLKMPWRARGEFSRIIEDTEGNTVCEASTIWMRDNLLRIAREDYRRRQETLFSKGGLLLPPKDLGGSKGR
jgi:hypothetical protein